VALFLQRGIWGLIERLSDSLTEHHRGAAPAAASAEER